MGPGHDSWHLANLGFNVTGLDFSPGMVQAAESLESNSGGVVYIGLKKGDADEIREETKYGKPMKRRFVLWQRQPFEELLKEANFEVIEFKEEVKGDIWLNFMAKNAKKD